MLGDVRVDRLDAATVLVRWHWLGGQRQPVTVNVSTGFDASPTENVVLSDADELTLRVPAFPRRVFTVRVAGGPAVVVAERRVAVAGTLNFRDLGGYRGDGGRVVRWGRVYRSDNLAAVDSEGWAALSGLGLRSVYDLRHETERERAPTVVPEGLSLSLTHLPIGGEAAEAPDLVALLTTGADRFGLEFMVEMNLRLLNEHAAIWGRLLTELCERDRLPALFYCTAGKDRTGIAAALLLSALGVERESILDDYELTTQYRSRHRIEELRPRLERSGVDVETVRPFLSAPRPALAAALIELDRRFGGIGPYLTEAAHVSSEVIERLRSELLTDPMMATGG